MNNYFKKTNPNIPKDRQDQILNPILYQDRDPEVFIVTDSCSSSQPVLMKKILKAVYKREVSITLLYCYTFIPIEKDLKKDITKFVNKYSTNYEDYIPKNTKVLALGRSIYTFTKEIYLTAEAFYSYLYTSTHFYYPPTGSYIFPVDDLYKMYSKEEHRLLDSFEYFFFKKQIQLSREFQVPRIRIPKLSFEKVENPNEFLTSYIGKDIEVAWDLETSGFIYYINNIICITMSFDGKKGYYLDWKKIDLEILNEFFKGKFQIGANLKFDCRFLRGRGVSNAKIDFDTLNGGHCLNERSSNSLGAHGWLYSNYGGHEIELHKYRKNHPKLKDFSQIPRSILSKYAVYDAVVCFQVYKTQKELLKKDSQMNSYYFNEVIPNLNLFLEVEINGVEIDWDYLSELQVVFDKKKFDLEEEIYELLGARINLASNKDLPLFLEHQLKMPDINMRGKNGNYLTNEDAMRTWAKIGNWPVAEKLLAYKSLCTQINTFIGSQEKNNAYWKYQEKSSCLIHPTYSVMLALSHRNKCSGPNLQQVPKQTKFAPVYRKIFVPPDYKDDLNFDLSKESIIIELENEKIELLPTSLCLIIRDNKELEVKAKDLLESDDFQKVIKGDKNEKNKISKNSYKI